MGEHVELLEEIRQFMSDLSDEITELRGRVEEIAALLSEGDDFDEDEE